MNRQTEVGYAGKDRRTNGGKDITWTSIWIDIQMDG
jgi:hypothetical protein